MKIDTFDDLERLLRLVNEHRLESLEVGEVKVTKTAWAHAVVSVDRSFGQAGTGHDADNERSIWDDPDLFPNQRRGGTS